jgi:quinol monooxygenase YgiN
MSRYALFVELKAKPGQEKEVADFLASAQPLAAAETGTVTWHAGQLDTGTFMIFDSFNDEAGREAHLAGPIAKALMANAERLLAEPPKIRKVDVIADKIS